MLSRSLLLRGAVDTLPLCLAVIPWGVLVGALGIQVGLSPIQAQAMSLIVFAGAAQLSSLSMLATASLGTIYLSTFVVSSRHLLYSIVFRERVLALSSKWRFAIGFLLTDETYAVSEAHTKRHGKFSPHYALGSGLIFYGLWNLATLFGIVLGDVLGDTEHLGLDFAIAATFIAMTFEEIKRIPVLLAIVVSGTVALFAKPYLPDAYIILAAATGMVSAFLVDHRPYDEEVPQ